MILKQFLYLTTPFKLHELHVIIREDVVIKDLEMISKGRLETFVTSTTLFQYSLKRVTKCTRITDFRPFKKESNP